MDQKQLKQVKKYRILKVLFYFLGFPLFIFTTFLASIKYIGHDPFVGNHLWEFPILETQVFNHFEEWISAPALYGVWVVMAIWVFVTLMHFIINKVCKNPRSKMMIVIVITIVSLLGTMFCMDYAFEKNISAMIDDVNAGKYADGVTVEDYKTQLSFYRRVTSDKDEIKSYYYQLAQEVERLEKVYAVDMYGLDKSGVAGNLGNTALYYDELIDDDGNRGVDVSFVKNPTTDQWELSLVPDGDPANDHIVVRDKPNSKGQLEINGVTYSHYYYVEKTPVTHDADGVYIWYTLDLFTNYTLVEKGGKIVKPKTQRTDGVYGLGLYNPNGLLADGYVLNLYNVLEILEDYYAGEVIVNDIIKEHSADVIYSDYDEWHAAVLLDAEQRMEDYYTGVSPDENGEYCSAFLQELYKSELTTAMNRFSLTRGRLDALLAEVGALLGNNGLFDLLLDSSAGGTIASLIGPVLSDLEEGLDLVSLIGMDASTKDTVCGIVGDIFGKPCTGLVLVLKYTDSDKGHFYFALKNNKIDPDSAAIMDLDFSNEVLGLELDDRFLYKNALGEWCVNTDYAFDLDHVSKLLSNALTYLLNDLTLFDSDGDSIKDQTLYDKVDELLGGTLGTVLGVVGGLINIDFANADATYSSLASLLDGLLGGGGALAYDASAGTWKFDVVQLLCGLLDGLYFYQSSAIQKVYEFYVDPTAEVWEQEAQKAMADKDRAYWTGAVQLPVMGSTVIGDELGAANDMNAVYKYTAEFGLTDLASVQQLKLDLSYQPVYYPLFTARDMILTFSGFVILFYFLSFVCAEKEVEYATGKVLAKGKKKDKKKANKEEEKVDTITTAPVVEETKEEAAEELISLEEIKEESVEEVAPKEESISLEEVKSTEEVG